MDPLKVPAAKLVQNCFLLTDYILKRVMRGCLFCHPFSPTIWFLLLSIFASGCSTRHRIAGDRPAPLEQDSPEVANRLVAAIREKLKLHFALAVWLGWVRGGHCHDPK